MSKAKKIVILGDSTIDNRVWLGKEKYHLAVAARSRFAWLIDFIAWFNPFKPKSVVENLKAQLPGVDFIDRTNDGFTTDNVLNGAFKDKVFGVGAHRFFPHTFFKPMATKEIEKADHIILSIGGNNLREFMLKALNISSPKNRKIYIQREYPKVLQKLLQDYQTILKRLSVRNPNANLILMTQYYPALNQKMLLDINLYDFMSELGAALNKGHAENAIVEVMKDTYNGLLKFITHDKSMRNMHISMVDVTSSLNPHFNENYEGQIEPSDIGGKCIAEMLLHVVQNSSSKGKKIYRFSPDYFMANAKKSEHVHTCEINTETRFTPVPPNAMLKHVQYGWKRNATTIAGGIIAGVGIAMFGAALPVVALASVLGAAIALKAASLWHVGYQPSLNWPWRVGYQTNPNLPYRFAESAQKNGVSKELNSKATKAWTPHLKSQRSNLKPAATKNNMHSRKKQTTKLNTR
jgi:hypothetical protein